MSDDRVIQAVVTTLSGAALVVLSGPDATGDGNGTTSSPGSRPDVPVSDAVDLRLEDATTYAIVGVDLSTGRQLWGSEDLNTGDAESLQLQTISDTQVAWGTTTLVNFEEAPVDSGIVDVPSGSSGGGLKGYGLKVVRAFGSEAAPLVLFDEHWDLHIGTVLPAGDVTVEPLPDAHYPMELLHADGLLGVGAGVWVAPQSREFPSWQAPADSDPDGGVRYLPLSRGALRVSDVESDVVVERIDEDGSFMWQETYQDSEGPEGQDTGATRSLMIDSDASQDFLLAMDDRGESTELTRLDPLTGDPLWTTPTTIPSPYLGCSIGPFYLACAGDEVHLLSPEDGSLGPSLRTGDDRSRWVVAQDAESILVSDWSDQPRFESYDLRTANRQWDLTLPEVANATMHVHAGHSRIIHADHGEVQIWQ